MKRGHLSDYFVGVVVKRLSIVETAPTKSNQHEFNSVLPLKKLLGEDDKHRIPTKFIWLNQEQEAISEEGTVTWYDARRNHPKRSEYRLYYNTNQVTKIMQPGDVFFLALCRNGSLIVIVVPFDSTIQNQLMWLFGLDDQPKFDFAFQEVIEKSSAELDFATRYILDEIGIDPEDPESDILDGIIEEYGITFPSTKVFSKIARDSLNEIDATADADQALLAWMDREEQLFRRLERKLVADRINIGFTKENEADVDGFISFSLSVQNRRKARAGQAFENHLEEIFLLNKIQYDRGAITENRSRPDFLFPRKEKYHDNSFPSDLLTMLGAKSTLKDRWRQVLSEANRIKTKHLITLEPSISENQTNEMKDRELQLIVPKPLHNSFTVNQQKWLLDLKDFIQIIKSKEANSNQI